MPFSVQQKACSTCIYRKDSSFDLPMLESEALTDDTFRVCHHSHDACCRGFWNKHKNNFNLGRIAQRLGVVRFVSQTTKDEGIL